MVGLIGFAMMMYKASSCLCWDIEDSVVLCGSEDGAIKNIDKEYKGQKKKLRNTDEVEKLII